MPRRFSNYVELYRIYFDYELTPKILLLYSDKFNTNYQGYQNKFDFNITLSFYNKISPK